LLECLFSPKEETKMLVKTNTFFICGLDKDQPCSYVFPSMMENQGLCSSGRKLFVGVLIFFIF